MNNKTRWHENRTIRVVIWIGLGSFGTALAVFYRNYIIYSQYTNPPDLKFYPLAFEYIAFALVALLFPWSWQKGRSQPCKQILYVGLTGLGFLIFYVFTLNYLEWTVRDRSYDFWLSLRFTALHSGIYTLVIYTIISFVLHYMGFHRSKKPKNTDYLKHIHYRNRNKTILIPIDQAVLFESNGNYIELYTEDDKSYLVRITLQKLETQLDPEQFHRIHRRYIVNMACIQSYKSDHQGGYIIYLKDDRELKVSKTYSESLRTILRK
ncbi:MAG: LytR/AlgR family response regulator transcription factor [Flavobacteriaceae bacterium]